jgi:pentatricopeptide repeat protein
LTSLLTAYARAGQLDEARALFDGMPRRTPVTWSAMFGQMQDRGVRPHEATFICVHGVEPGVEHYGSMMDVLGRTGQLVEAVGLTRAMPISGRRLGSVRGLDLAARSGLY